MMRLCHTESRTMQRLLLAFVLALFGSLVPIHSAKLPKYEVTLDVQSALDRISSNSLRGNLSFLASDLLEGRATPSRGLDIAAEFIASQFRRAGLEPALNGDYFQVADILVRRPNLDGFTLEFANKKRSLKIAPDDAIIEAGAALDLKFVPLFKLVADDTHKPEDLNGKIVVLRLRDGRTVRDLLRKAHPALLVVVGRTSPGAMPSESLVDPAQPENAPATPRIVIFSPQMDDFVGALNAGPNDATASVHLSAPAEQRVKLRNVIGVLPGSDPALKDTYVLVTAHYDHLGMKPAGEGDPISTPPTDHEIGTVSIPPPAPPLP